MRVELQLILTAIVVNSVLTSARSSHLTEDRLDFRNLFDSIAKNDEKKNEAYRKLVRNDIKEERQAFDAIKGELSVTKVENIHLRRNSHQKSNSIGDSTMQNKRSRRNDDTNKVTKLPVSGENFETCVQNNKIIVDKTRYMKELLRNDRTETVLKLISRPPGYGKSFFINMLECFFLNKKHLFESTVIYNDTIPGYPWKKYPIIKINFAEYTGLSPENMEQELIKRLIQIGKENNVQPHDITRSVNSEVAYLLKELSKNSEPDAILLIDDYDSPYVHSLLAQDGNAQTISSIMLDFFAGIESVPGVLKFGLVTGCHKLYDGAGLATSWDVLSDVSMDPILHDLIGFTASEVDQYYTDVLLQNIETRRGVSSKPEIDRLSSKLRYNLTSWYNHYRFTAQGNQLYSALSVVEFLNELPSKIKTNSTKTSLYSSLMTAAMNLYPAELIQMVADEKKLFPLYPLDLGYSLDTKDLLAGEDFKEVIKFLYHEGYMTIAYETGQKNRVYFLKGTNRERRITLWQSLKQTLLPEEVDWVKFLDEKDFESFFSRLENCFTRSYSELNEYDTLVSFCLSNGELIKVIPRVRIERCHSSEYVLESSRNVFIFEYKKNSTMDFKPPMDMCKDEYRKNHRNNGTRALFCIQMLFEEVAPFTPRRKGRFSSLEPRIWNWSVKGLDDNGSIIEEHNRPTAS